MRRCSADGAPSSVRGCDEVLLGALPPAAEAAGPGLALPPESAFEGDADGEEGDGAGALRAAAGAFDDVRFGGGWLLATCAGRGATDGREGAAGGSFDPDGAGGGVEARGGSFRSAGSGGGDFEPTGAFGNAVGASIKVAPLGGGVSVPAPRGDDSMRCASSLTALASSR